MYIDEQYYCNSLEDTDRGLHQDMPLADIKARKVYGMTAIPTGRYRVRMSYSPKYKRQMPEVLDVPGYSGIRIHSGNTADDSLGCILLGVNNVKGKVTNSRATCAEFEKRLIAAGGECELEIV